MVPKSNVLIYYQNLLPKSTILIHADEACRPEGEARFGHLDLLFLWHPAEDHAQPWILHLVPALSTLLGWLVRSAVVGPCGERPCPAGSHGIPGFSLLGISDNILPLALFMEHLGASW